MKILQFEDDLNKYMDIASVLKSVGVTDVIWVESLEKGMQILDENANEIDVIISDMYFPIKASGKPDGAAGEEVLKMVKEKHYEIPVIMISSDRIVIPEAYKCIWYSDSVDWEIELRNEISKCAKFCERRL